MLAALYGLSADEIFDMPLPLLAEYQRNTEEAAKLHGVR